MASFHTLMVASVDPLTDDSAAVTFAVPAALAEEFAFAAGQSLTLRRELDGVEHRRSYSICAPVGSAPRIGVREVPNGLFSSWLVREVRPGATIDVQVPTGSFRADPHQGAHHLCIAAGSGITPMLSVASSVLRNPESRVTLLYGNRTTRSVMFAEELADLKNRHCARFSLMHVFSREPRDVELFSGRLEGERLRTILTELVPLTDVDHVWLCGPLAMIDESREILADHGVAPQKVHVELFFVDEPPPERRYADEPIEGATSQVTIVIDGRSTKTPMPRSRTILDSAQQTRTDLPFACKGGVCGTCRARIRTGEVDMVRNYALEAGELAQGFVLTCQSFPVSDDVTVDFDA